MESRKEAAMKTPGTMQVPQLEKFARFLEEHPGFSPLLEGEDAVVCGFQAGDCFLTLDEMERLIAPQTPRELLLRTLLTAGPSMSKRRVP
jgi:hypothetical protein